MKKLYKSILLTFILMVAMSEMGISQTITLGTGTNTNAYNEPSPVNVTNRRNVSHTVYTVAELNAAGVFGPKTINKMGYFITNIPTLTMNGYTINMKHTNATNAAGAVGNGGYTTVKNAFNYNPNQGLFDLLDLDTPFNWNGTQNIAVRICWETQPNGNPSGQLRTYASTNGFRFRVNNGGGGSYCGQTPNTNRNWKPQIRFVFDTETVWTGAVNTDWFNAGNWSSGIPNKNMDTRIPVGTPNNPNLIGVASVALFTLEGSMTMSAAGSLNVYGDFINTGTYTDNGGQTILTGEGPNTITNSAALPFTNLIVESKFGGVISGSNVTIINELQVNKSKLNTNGLITLRSDASGTARINELTTNCFYELDMFDAWGDGWNGGTLTVLENGVPINVYQAYYASTNEIVPVENGATIQLQYSAGIFENENSYTFSNPAGTPIFSDGPNPSTGIVFTTTANCGFTPPITGAVTMERYIDAGETYWRYFGSAVQGATFQQFEDDFVTAGYPGSAFPNFPFVSAYTYDETLGPGLGYLECTGTSQAIGVGQGIQVWCGDTITGTQPFTFDLTGVPNQGDINLPVTYTNFGVPAEDGFNQVSNPYPSTIDWDSPSWVKTNMANATYILNPDNQQYATYVAGAATNGGSRFIASQQSFWVKAFAAAPVLTAREQVKSSVDQGFFKAQTTYSPGLKITLQGNQEFDEAILRHIDGAVDAFEYAYDADKWWGGWGQYPQVSLINGENKDLTVHSFDKNSQEWSIPLRAIVFQDGMYNLEFNNISELDVPCVQLEDIYTGTIYSIQEGTVLPLQMYDTTYAPRFIIHLGRNYDLTSSPASCFGINDGEIILDLDDPNAVDYVLTNNGVNTNGNAFGDPLVISGLASGIYSIEIPTLVNLCSQTVFNVVVNQPAPLSVTETVLDEVFGNDGSISLVTIGNGPFSYYWDNGQTGNTITNLSSGNYNVIVSDVNGCESAENYFVDSQLALDELISEIELFYNIEQNVLRINGKIDPNNSDFRLYSSEGKLINTYQLSSVLDSQTINIPSGLATGIYIFGNGSVALKFKK
jgi:hypothetical protein